MGWLKNLLLRGVVATQRREMIAFTTNLSAMDAEEIGLVVACANHQRLLMLENSGWDFNYPAVLADHPSNIPVLLGNAIIELQRQGRPQLAAGIWVWVHTLRAFRLLELRQDGRDLWRQLARGFPFVDSAADGAALLFGQRFRTEGAGVFPDGLTPDRVSAEAAAPKRSSIRPDAKQSLTRTADLELVGVDHPEKLKLLIEIYSTYPSLNSPEQNAKLAAARRLLERHSNASVT
jgi:hypothetical protein